MSKKKLFVLTAGAMMVASAIGTVQAQEVPVKEENASARDGVSQLETVTVTARRREEKAQDVPAPISVISGRELEAQRLYQIQDLQQALPNVTSQFLHARQSSVAVRGIGNNTANEGLEGSVGIYLDNVFLGRPGQAVFDLLDVEQIDLLRGPQGTLFGKNTTAGVVNITSRQPTFEKEGSIEASIGNRGYQQYKGSYSGPISDTVAFRISAYDTHDDGWVKNVQNGERLNEINRQGVRGQLLIKPSADFSLRLIGEHNEEDSSTGTLIPYSYGPLNRGAFNSASNYTTYAQWAALQGASKVITDPYKYEVSINDAQQAKVKQNAFSAEANWKLGDYRLTSITAWRDWKFDPKNDLDYTDLSGMTGGFNTTEDQFSQELRLASPTGGFYDYVVGAYYYQQNTSSDNRYDLGTKAYQLSGGSYPSSGMLSGRGEAKTDSVAVFGQGTLHFTPSFDLTGGLRFTSEKKEGHVVQNAVVLNNPAYAAYANIPVYKAWDSGNLSRTDDSLAGLLTASYRLAERVLGYATVSHGEKSGGYNVNSVASAGSAFGVEAITIEPEKADNVELGVKSNWFNNRLVANGNLFLTKITGYQAATNVYYPVTNSYLSVLTNVGDVTSKGFEFDFKAQPTSNLSLSLNGAYTLARFDNGTAPTPFEVFNGTYGRGSRSIAGNTVNGAPKWTFNVGAQYRRFLENSVEQYVNANYSWRSETYGDINNSVYSKIPSYGLFNLATGFRIPYRDGRWDVSLWAKNVFDKHYFLGLTTVGNNYYVGSAGQPRSVGASVRYDFF